LASLLLGYVHIQRIISSVDHQSLIVSLQMRITGMGIIK